MKTVKAVDLGESDGPGEDGELVEELREALVADGAQHAGDVAAGARHGAIEGG